jgi:hypothetical protein
VQYIPSAENPAFLDNNGTNLVKAGDMPDISTFQPIFLASFRAATVSRI